MPSASPVLLLSAAGVKVAILVTRVHCRELLSFSMHDATLPIFFHIPWK